MTLPKILVTAFLILGLVVLLGSYVGWLAKILGVLAISLVALGLMATIVSGARWKWKVRTSRDAFFQRYAGRRLYVVSRTRDWGNFVRNNIQPVLLPDEELIWRRGNHAWWMGVGLPLSAELFCTGLGEMIKIHGHRFPLLVRVDMRTVSWVDLHDELRALKLRTTAKDAETQGQVRSILDAARGSTASS